MGYDCKIGDTIEVSLEDCKNNHEHKVTMMCDKCGQEEIISLENLFNNYYPDKEYLCNKCKKEKLNSRKCDICGNTHGVSNYLNKGQYLCSKHKKQIRKYGHIKRTIYDKNEIRIFDDYAEFDTYDKYGQVNGTFLIDLDMVDFVRNNKIYKHEDGYATYHLKGSTKEIRLHRKIMNMEDGNKSIYIDHINGKKWDDRRCNLRLVTPEGNGRNVGMYCHNTSGYKGISIDKRYNKYEAYIHNKNKKISLGLHNTLDEAILYRELAELLLYKEFSPRYNELKDKYKDEKYDIYKQKIKDILETKINNHNK